MLEEERGGKSCGSEMKFPPSSCHESELKSWQIAWRFLVACREHRKLEPVTRSAKRSGQSVGGWSLEPFGFQSFETSGVFFVASSVLFTR
jgi:hypothetical protein